MADHAPAIAADHAVAHHEGDHPSYFGYVKVFFVLLVLTASEVGALYIPALHPILPFLRRLMVRQYVLEFTIPVAGDFAVLRQLPDDRQIGLGCVDCRSAHVDTPEAIADRGGQALRHVDAERLWRNPDCGFAPGSAADIPIDEAYAKLRNEAAAAALLRSKRL